MRCDLHVHTIHSGQCTVPGLSRYCLESSNEPLALYETLKRRGMDLVTVTDHDSIDAGEELRKYPDFFLSEEVTVTLPSGTAPTESPSATTSSCSDAAPTRRVCWLMRGKTGFS